MKKIDYEHFGRFVYPKNLRQNNGVLYYCIGRADFEDNNYKSDLYCMDKGKQKRLTSSGDVRAFELYDDGIVFQCLRNPKDKERAKKGIPLTVFYKLPYNGGEAEEFMRLDYSANTLLCYGEKKYLFKATVNIAYEEALKRNNGDHDKSSDEITANNDYVVIDEIPFWFNGMGFINKKRDRLYSYVDGKITQLTEDYADVGQLILSTDKTKAYFTSTTYTDSRSLNNKLYEYDIATGSVTDISIQQGVNHTVIENNGTIVVLASMSEKYGLNENNIIYVRKNGIFNRIYDGGMHNFYNIVGTDIRMGGMPIGIIKDGKYYTIDTINDSAHIVAVDMCTGNIEQITNERGMVNEFIFVDNDIYAIAMREGGMELYLMGDKETQLSDLNTKLIKDYDYAKPIDMSFVNEKGDTIYGFVLPPINMEKGKKYPTILDVHGGPKTVYGNVYYHEMQMWASMGYAVIFCNPTGSDGRGDRFADIRGHYGDIEFRDLMTFVDKAIDQFDFIDKNRMGVTGGSYGGFMTNWIIGHTDRFLCAASQRSISNFMSFSNMSDIGDYFGKDQCGADIWHNYEQVWAQSPLRYADKVKTPTLFIHSDADYRCPLAEGIQMFYALRQHGVETRMCIFKGENHELSRSGLPKHRVRRLKEITEWMNKYLKA